MKKITFLKSLLVAACVMVGSSAWADSTTTLWEKGTTGNDWTDSDAAKYHAETAPNGWTTTSTYTGAPTVNVSIVDNALNVKSNIRNHAFTASKAIATTTNSTLTIDAVWNSGNNTGGAGDYSYIKFGDVEVRAYGQDKNTVVVIGGVSTTISTNQNDVRNCDMTIHFEINRMSKAVSYDITLATSGKKSGNGTVSTSDFSGVTMGFDYTTTDPKGKTDRACTLKSIKIDETVTTADLAGYTINYQLSGTTVKTVSATNEVNAVITAETAIDGTEEGYVGNHYLITASEAPSMTLVASAASNVLNVPVRAPYTATLKVTTTLGTNDPVLVSTPLTETDAKVCTWSYAYPMYVLNGGSYYKADNTSTFGESGVFTDGQVVEKSVTYSIDKSIVFFQEAEASAGTNYTYSNGGTGYVAAQNKRDRGISVGTLPAGTYSIIAKITAANKRSLGIRQSTNDFLASVGTSTDDMTTGVKSANFTLNEETSSLFINGANSGTEKTNQSEDFDYVLIKYAPVPVSVTADGYATLCPEYNLDFTSATAIEACKASVTTGGVITLTKVNTVKAGEGVLLRSVSGGAANEDIPVIASADANAENAFVGIPAKIQLAQSTEAGYTNYILSKKSDVMGFYKVNAAGSWCKAGSAYLKVEDTLAPARGFFALDEEETTGICDKRIVKIDESANATVFDLQGRRVAQPRKGLYINNGRKVVIK